MDSIITFFQNLIKNYSTPENCELLKNSLETQISTIKNEISELDIKINQN